jgi:hypothetical protein
VELIRCGWDYRIVVVLVGVIVEAVVVVIAVIVSVGAVLVLYRHCMGSLILRLWASQNAATAIMELMESFGLGDGEHRYL